MSSDDTDKDGEGQPDEYLVKHDGEVIGEVEAETEYEAEQKAHDLILSEVWVERVDGAVENRVDQESAMACFHPADEAGMLHQATPANRSARSTDAPSEDEDVIPAGFAVKGLVAAWIAGVGIGWTQSLIWFSAVPVAVVVALSIWVYEKNRGGRGGLW